MSFSSFWFAVSLSLLTMTVVGLAATPAAGDNLLAKRFVEYYESTVRPREIEAAQWFWTANVTGKEEDFQKKQAAEEKVELLLSDPERFADLKAIRHSKVSDRLLARQIDVLYLEYLAKQVDHDLLMKMLAKSNAVERAFNVFRPHVGGKTLTDNDVRRILRESRDSAQRQAAWEASKKVGPVVVGDLRELVALRNQAARKLGFKNYYVLQLYCGEQSPQQLLKLFDQLDDLTRKPFHEAKAQIDAALAERYGIAVGALRPWHYHDPFFQEVPAVLGELPESVYQSLDTVAVCRAFYDGIGLPVDDVLGRSDLYEKPGKNPHAFSIDINRAGDIRVLENIVPGEEWLRTTLHELGHADYSKNVASNLPYVLHTDAHPLCTEGVAMMFERFAQNVDWLKAMGAKVSEPEKFRTAAAKLRRNRLLVFSRYCQVMFRFEMALYEDPKQDLNRLWWDLVEKYQEVKRPEGRKEPDYASKYHLIGAPAYYHNYMLGEMFASQVHHALVRQVLPGVKPAGAIYVGNKAAGEFMRQRVFKPGLMVNWSFLTRLATGEELSPEAFAEDLETDSELVIAN
jgi:peptidyl-dipeptidase A